MTEEQKFRNGREIKVIDKHHDQYNKIGRIENYDNGRYIVRINTGFCDSIIRNFTESQIEDVDVQVNKELKEVAKKITKKEIIEIMKESIARETKRRLTEKMKKIGEQR